MADSVTKLKKSKNDQTRKANKKAYWRWSTQISQQKRPTEKVNSEAEFKKSRAKMTYWEIPTIRPIENGLLRKFDKKAKRKGQNYGQLRIYIG